MVFAFDYDGTWSVVPNLCAELVALMKEYGHEAVIVTARKPDNPVPVDDIPVHYTSGAAKRTWGAENDVLPDVWIDNDPWMVVHGTGK